ncbi:hypothetical protein HHI36_006484 [Cryptolaemus montrouzieri]|uniref:Plexin domain-containing protein 2 n=1 Tax=Cryptolaemus montrouzieri TaxID=559131 RepID=A0ABD2NXA2_9CUCU
MPISIKSLTVHIYLMRNASLICDSMFYLSDQYLYKVTQPESSTYHDISLKLLEYGENHHRRKRQTTEAKPLDVNPAVIKNDTSSEINKTTRFNDHETQTLSRVNLTRTVSQVPLLLNDSKSGAKLSIPLQVPLIFPSNVTRIGTEKDVRLLGVNGTGQRKTYSFTTAKPSGISSSFPPLLHDIAKNKTGKSNFDDFVDKISISKFSDKELNKTLAEHNITNETITESYFYYNSTFITDPEVAKHYWVNLSNFENATTHELLSSAHRRAATVTLSFEFPFYGNRIKNVTMATGGFLYTGDYVHAWLAATQYIAPLMANFDTSLSNDSFVRYIDNGTAFTVLWEKVALKDRADEGEFTFQTTLHKNGDIVFVYQNVPMIIEDIKDDQHPVKVGLSDAYIIDSTIFFIRRKTIYEYHRVNFQKEDIKNGTVILLKALPTCLDQTDCESCLTNDISSFQCVWCPGLKKCSNGVDRYRQSWLMKGCDQTKIKNETHCSRANSYHPSIEGNPAYVHDSFDDRNVFTNITRVPSSSFRQPEVVDSKTSRMGISGVFAIMLLICMVVGMTMWVLYAYRNPHTTSGQMLIRYRPTQWRWKRGEARYTAATIHM